MDRYPIADTGIRDVLVHYLVERSTVLDYSSLNSQAQLLADLFWCDLETPPPRDQLSTAVRPGRPGMEGTPADASLSRRATSNRMLGLSLSATALIFQAVLVRL
ncbi:hypothetical protein ACFT1B_36390 [Streptomyces griseoincarnatus]|uniref:hypothetical protein n=1 Tax=Promicromonospora sp. NPDC057138 TaxID=3346031 RepID=UPI003633F110